jgi:hypothetical protein
MDWYDIKFLESPSNLKMVLSESIGRTPSTLAASGISTCLQQGRFFFEAAENSPLEIRPLQVFYGIVGFSKAIAASRKAVSTNALSQAHGLKDISETNSLLENLTLKIQNRGTFQDANDAICELDSINYFGEENDRQKIYMPTAQSSRLIGLELTFKEIASRIPGMSEIYRKTFNEEPNNLSLSFYHRDNDLVDLRIDLPELFQDRHSLKKIVTDLRTKYPFLKKWLLSEAQRCWDCSILKFTNVTFDTVVEFSDNILTEREGRFSRMDVNREVIPFEKILPSLSGGVVGASQNCIRPAGESEISEQSLVYMGVFLLGSLVRYRPEIWVHSINGRSTTQRSYDDHCMAMIESFLGMTLSTYPQYVKNCLETKLNK